MGKILTFVGLLSITLSTSAYADNPINRNLKVTDVKFKFVNIHKLPGLEVQTNEITYAQWNALNSAVPAENQTPWEATDCNFRDYIKRGFGPNYPAACISVKDAEAYIRVLNAQDPKYTYRLPTDEEVRTLEDMTEPALTINKKLSHERFSKHAWYYYNSDEHAHEVCTKEPVFGLCDIFGNLWEQRMTPEGTIRYIHNGSWLYNALFLYSAVTYPVDSDSRWGTVGFRLVRTLN